MTIAEQKLQQNIAEYVLFVWQMEDLVRAVYFDAQSLEDFIRSYTPDDTTYEAEMRWFSGLIEKMKSERVEKKGHINEVHEILFELFYLHNTLLNIIKEKTYLDLYREAKPNIEAYLEKSGEKSVNDVEACFVGLYGLMLLRLRKEPVSAETEAAMRTFSNMLARLAHHYKVMKKGELNFALN
ncbi:MAG: hypothetical protein RL220_1724 [Bacteroidota bacterium]|jgi:hypothetical protein